MPDIDKNQPIPVYYQLAQLLRQKIDAGEWNPGDLIPSERQLCAEHGISRMTVRQALTELVKEGKLLRERGRGTFVGQPKIEQHLGSVTSFTQDMSARGWRAEARVLRQEMVPASPEVARALATTTGQPVFLLERLRLANDEPLAVETCHLLFPGCDRLQDAELATGSLYTLLSVRFGIEADRAHQQMEAVIVEPRVMPILQIARGAAVLDRKSVV
jgi:GntR family transcriptional regulator